MMWVSDRTMGDHTWSTPGSDSMRGFVYKLLMLAAVIWRIRKEGRALAGGSAGERWGDRTHERRGVTLIPPQTPSSASSRTTPQLRKEGAWEERTERDMRKAETPWWP